MEIKQLKMAAISEISRNLYLDTPEKRLLFEIVAQAIRDLSTADWRKRKLQGHYDPHVFFKMPETSFEHIAEQIDLSVSFVQKTLRTAGLIE